MAALLWYYSSLGLIAIVISMKLIWLRQTRRFKNLPPCPPTLPIIGNLHHLKPHLHRSLHALSKTYGQIFSLWFGSRLVVVISSEALARECFTKYDAVLANRPPTLTGKYLFYNYTSLVFTSYGERFRNLRRIVTTDVLSTQRLNYFVETRRDEVMKFIRNLVQDTTMGFTRVELRSRLTELTSNNIMRMVFGSGDDEERNKGEELARQFKEIVGELMPLVGANKSDFLPLLRWFDFDGFVKSLKTVSKKADAFWQGLIDEHRSRHHGNGNQHGTMIHHLLSLQITHPHHYSDSVIKALIQDIIVGATNTTTMTIEWAMSALLNHPDILQKAKQELDAHIGNDRLLDESDIPNLPYLQNIIYETLRLYSPSPLLLPHFSSDECNIGGFTVPCDTTVLINAWAIRRDPEIWGDVECFKPERFEKEEEISKLIAFAFGLGRRTCPGTDLGLCIANWALGLLIQCFEWKRLSNEKIDMRETEKFAMSKLIPLEALCKAQPISKKVKQC